MPPPPVSLAKTRKNGYNTPMLNKTLLVAGLGLLGGSVAKASVSLFNTVIGLEPDPSVRQAAVAAGAVSACYAKPCELPFYDIACLCVPVRSAPALLAELFAKYPRALYTDTGSTKLPITQLAAEKGIRFCGMHPMAGSERSGFAASRGDLFNKAAVCITEGSPEDTAFLTEWIRQMGGEPLSLSARRHDAAVAAVSHLPHLLASALIENAHTEEQEEPLVARLAAGGFADMTRIAASDPVMWRDIFLDNQALPAQINRLCGYLGQWQQDMQAGNGASLQERFARTRGYKEHFTEKGGIFRAGKARHFRLLGEGISYSLSPFIHRFFYEQLHENAQYELLDVPPGDLGQAVEFLRSCAGANVTRPYKEVVLPLLEELSPAAKRLRAVNTITVRSGRLFGDNTDISGFARAYGELLKGRAVLVLGAGGGAAAAALACAQNGSPVTLWSRNPQKAERLAKQLCHPLIAMKAQPQPHPVLVNATSAGYNGSTLELPFAPEGKLFIDLGYQQNAPFAELAKQAGGIYHNGLPMLLYQAAESARIWGFGVTQAVEEKLLPLLRAQAQV